MKHLILAFAFVGTHLIYAFKRSQHRLPTATADFKSQSKYPSNNNNFDPFKFRNQLIPAESENSLRNAGCLAHKKASRNEARVYIKTAVVTAGATSYELLTDLNSVSAATNIDSNLKVYDPSNFQPVCPGSDGIYQGLKGVATSLIGQENVAEYTPLIASILLRVRLEICVLESFLYEAIIPFVQQKGLSWVFPLHESLETFLAGTIFAVACNVILLGSSKIISIIFVYGDVLTGMPARFIGNLLTKVPPVAPVGLAIKVYGDVIGVLRNVLDKIDTFISKYLVVVTTGYIVLKLVHFKFLNF